MERSYWRGVVGKAANGQETEPLISQSSGELLLLKRTWGVSSTLIGTH